jgi:hypothetical protein
LFTALAVVVYFLAFNASYHYWDGGSSTGPRHITPALGFACFPLGFMWTRAGRSTRKLMLTVLGLSFLLSLICASVSMDVPAAFRDPLFQTLIPRFLSGDVNNLGRLVGIPGSLSLLPLIVVWAIAGRRIVHLLPPGE